MMSRPNDHRFPVPLARPLSWLDGRLPGWQWRSLWALLSGPDRHHHGLGTVDALWRRHLAVGGAASDDVAAFSIAYHHAAPQPRPGAGMQASIDLWMDHASRAGKDDNVVDAVTECLLALSDPSAVRDDAPEHVRWAADLELLYLAGDRPVVDRTLEAMRRDFADGDLAFAAHVAGLMHSLLLSPTIYRTAGIRAGHEQEARDNARRTFAVTSRALSRTIHTTPFN